MNITIQLATINDVDELEQLYNDLNDYLEKGITIWKRSIKESFL